MISSELLKRHWASITDDELRGVLRSANESLDAFSRATRSSGSLIQSWAGGKPMVEYAHCPDDDVIDLRRGSQFFYHAHRSRGNEHGHVHLFWHASESGRRRYVRSLARRWVRTAPTHLIAIALDDRGLPVSLFTVNRWVTDGHWFDAWTTLSLVDKFEMKDVAGHESSCAWVTNFVRMYRPVIEELLRRRDHRLSRYAGRSQATSDQALEELSLLKIDWGKDLDALQREVARRAKTANP
jgi:hypothetical protein